MAKAKKDKSEKTDQPASQTKPKAAAMQSTASAAAPPAKPKKAAKANPPPQSVPLIDTSLAASAAAKMVANRDLLGAAKPQPTGEKRESGAFKQLKESFLKPAVQGPGGLLTPQTQQKKSNTGFGGRNQVGHNQTFGADVNRTGVPRRTGGG